MSNERKEPKRAPLWKRGLHALEAEFVGIHPRLQAYNLLDGFLPLRSSSALRAQLLRLSGFSLGAGTRVHGSLRLNGPPSYTQNLTVGAGCTIEANCILDLSERISIGERVTLAPGVMILTSTHELDFAAHRAGPVQVKPVTVGDGAWLGARCILLPGVNVGAGAVVEPGAVVNVDVAADTRVGGVPAVKLGVLTGDQKP
jgi:maltose O-acetyltransferase